MTRNDLIELVKSGAATCVHYRTIRDYYNMLLNRQLEDDRNNNNFRDVTGPIILVIETGVPNCPRAGEIIP